ncbi:MAG: hypothetical protein ACRCXT_19820 [Paraclostridium sp.]
MRIQIILIKWNGTEELLKFNANNRLINETEHFSKSMEVSQVILKITNSIANDLREFRAFTLNGVMA